MQYGTGVIAEHMAVRTACGLFDVSHMGEILCEGEAALDNLNHLLTNDDSADGCGCCREFLRAADGADLLTFPSESDDGMYRPSISILASGLRFPEAEHIVVGVATIFYEINGDRLRQKISLVFSEDA